VAGVDDDPYAPIAEIYDHWCAEVTEDIPYYLAVCLGAAGPVVEIGAGTGRIAIPLALAGHRVIALDRSRPMLDRLVANAREAGVEDRIEVVQGDLRDLPALPATDRVIAPFRVLLHLETDDDRREFLAAAHELLVKGGLLAFDVFEPTRRDIRETHGRDLERDSGVRERAVWDADRGRLDLEVRYRGRRTTMELSWVPGSRWVTLLGDAGYELVGATAGFDGEPFHGRPGDSAFIAERVRSRP
jgi:SAM-dependent methyltransferase